MSGDRSQEYLVVGAGAVGLAFVDALIDHSDARVVLIDERPGPGGHWRDAYPFVRLHQASCFYGVASTLLGNGRQQTEGPEAGLQERATGAEVRAYYEAALERMCSTGRVEFEGGARWTGDRSYTDASGRERTLSSRCRITDARYRAARIPATAAPPFGVLPGARVIPVNDLPRFRPHAEEYVVAGSGKTATDACIWLLQHGVAPESICWIRPREPWMANRAHVQPDPATMFAMVASTWEAAVASTSLDDFFLRLEGAGIMLRIDQSRTPTMAKAPTLGEWELDLLRSIPRVERGRLVEVAPGALRFEDRTVPVGGDAVVVHCAVSAHAYPPLVPIWDEVIRLQTIRAGFVPFNAALAGYVEATRRDDDEKNRLCPPSPLPDTCATWAQMQVLGARASASYLSEPDIASWAGSTALNPARLLPADADNPQVAAAIGRIKRSASPAIARLAGYIGLRE